MERGREGARMAKKSKMRPAWLSKLKQVGEALKAQRGSEMEENGASLVRRKREEAEELARSLSLRRAKARAESSRSEGESGAHRLSRFAGYGEAPHEEEREVGKSREERELDKVTMALLESSLGRSKIAKHKELADRAARAALELKARHRAAASDDAASVGSERAHGWGLPGSRGKGASGLPSADWRGERHYKAAAQVVCEEEASSIPPPSYCTSEDGAAGASLSGSEDGWDRPSRSTRGSRSVAATEDWDSLLPRSLNGSSSRASESGELRGSWGSDLFAKLRALKQLHGQAEDESEGESSASASMQQDGWQSGNEASADEQQESGSPARHKSGSTPTNRQGGPSPSRREVMSSPGRDEVVYQYQYAQSDSDHKRADFEAGWKGSRSRGRQGKPHASCFIPNHVSGVVRESVAMVKYSDDPYQDFRHSMLEMILEKDIHQPPDLEELLHSYLTLNSPRQYQLINKAFTDTWNELLERRSKTFWGAV